MNSYFNMTLAVLCSGGLGAVAFHKTNDVVVGCLVMGIVAVVLIGIDILVDTTSADRDK